MATQHATAAMLRAEFSYDPSTGVLTRISTNRPTGRACKRGYVYVTFNGRSYIAHRVAWCIATGAWPEQQIDHINGDKSDNRLANLRDVSGLVNSQNMHRAKRNNGAGTLNVSRYKSGRYIARIFREGRRIYLGSYGSPEQAIAAVEVGKSARTTFPAW